MIAPLRRSQPLPEDPTIPLAPADSFSEPASVAPTAGPEAAPPTPVDLRHLPATIGRYRIVRLLGEGGMGAVYEAEQESPRRRVALKVIKAALASPELLRRFEGESQALGRLQHPGIAQIYEAGSAETPFGVQPFFAMELIHGMPLVQYADELNLDSRERLQLLVQVCDAVHHAHQRGIIHRDLKPGNILVDETGQAKILDFGLARATDSDAEATRQTDIGQLLGTLAYMSPEQVLGDPLALDTRSDVYSLGVILYQLLASKMPYALSRHLHEAVKTIQETDPAPLSSVNRMYRGDIETIAAKALEKDKSRRYTSAAELAADIRRYLNNDPIVARPPSTTYQLTKFARKNRILVGGVAAVMLTLAAGAILSTIFAIRAFHAQKLADERRIQTDQARAIAVQREHEAITAQKLAEQRQVEAEAARSSEARQRIAAEQSAQRAKEASLAAQKNFNLARDAVDNYFTRVSESSELKAHNLEHLRRQLLLTARDFYQKFVNTRSGDSFLKADLGAAMLRLGNADLQIGDNAQAKQSLLHSRQILEAAFQKHPDDQKTAENLFSTYASLGLLYANTNQFDQAENSYQKAVSFMNSWRAAHTLDGEDLNRLADLHDSYGTLLTRAGKVPLAQQSYQSALAIRRELVKQFPDSDDYKNGLIMTDINMVSTMAAANHVPLALPYARESVKLGETLYASHPADPDILYRLGASYNNLGGLYTLLGQNDEAEKAHLRAAHLREILSAQHPAIVDYSIGLAGSYINLGELAERRNDADAALNWLKKGENVLLGVLAGQPHESKARYYLSYDYSWQARAYDTDHDTRKVAQTWAQAIQYDDHNDPSLRVGRALALARLGDTTAATALADKLVAGNPQTDDLFELAGVYALADQALSTQHAQLANADGAKSVALLSRVASAGYFHVPEQMQALKTGSQFSAIRDRADFKQMLSTLQPSN